MKNLLRDVCKNYEPYNACQSDYEVILNANESPQNLLLKLPQNLLDEVLNKINLMSYPDNNSVKLREAYAKYANVLSENVIVGNGGDQMLLSICDAFLEEGEVCVSPVPTFVMYQLDTELVKGRFIGLVSEDEFLIPSVDELIETSNRENAKLIFITNPNNPTGYSWDREDVIRIIEETKAIVVIDEAYFEFLGETNIDLIYKYDRVIIIRTLSKAFSLAGLRVGFAISNNVIIEKLHNVKQTFNVTEITQKLSILLLENIELVKENIHLIVSERTYVQEQLANFDKIKMFPSKANYILLQTDEAQSILDAMEKEKIILRSFKGNYIRVTIGTREENDRVLEIMKKVLPLKVGRA